MTDKNTLSDFNVPENFINRELSWLKFNLRVLKEAGGKEHPPLERLRFIAIAASNLDEFFMVRVAGLINYLENGYNDRDPSGLSVKEQLTAISYAAHRMKGVAYRYLFATISELRNYGIYIERLENVGATGKEWLRRYFDNTIYPVLTPMAVDASRPFPFLANRSLNLAITLKKTHADADERIAFVQVPSVLPRLLQVETGEAAGKNTFIFLEELIMFYCQKLFPGFVIQNVTPFRITRNADLYIDEADADNLLQEVEKSLKQRKRGDAVRLELNSTGSYKMEKFLMKNLELDNHDVYYIRGPIDITCLYKLINLPEFAHLCYNQRAPQIPSDLINCEDIFRLAAECDILLHHPFESFDPVIKLVQDAAGDPDVLAIKQTLYRVSGDSPIVAALARAAENGKQVTVLVELKARFDEENNIIWAKRLEKAGCHVIYGLIGLKTHSKIILIVRKENTGIKRYVHLGTGNYNDSTAKLYTDLGLITSNEQVGADASAFFNVLSGYSEPPLFDKLVMAPIGLRQKLHSLLDREIDFAQKGQPAHIIAKMNSLIDTDIILKLYEASNAGVHIDLVVRGICGLQAGKPGVSENISVRSIIGRYLEHTRIFYFLNGGADEIYLSSADWMERNLNDRVELFFPVESRQHIERLRNMLDIYIKDNSKTHIMAAKGNYRRPRARGEKFNAQEILYRQAVDAVERTVFTLEQKMKPLYKKETAFQE